MHGRSLVRPGQEVYLERDASDTDRYGRLLRYVWTADPEGASADPEESMLNALMVSSGHARACACAPDLKHAALLESLDCGDGEGRWAR